MTSLQGSVATKLTRLRRRPQNCQMSKMPFISVVISTYNRAHLVTTAIKSVLAQTYPNIEVIVVDDGSTDGTSNALAPIAEQSHNNGKQVTYLYQSNQGPSVARNTGIEKAQGEWLAFLDSDDTWCRDKLEWQVRAIEQFKEDCGACFTDARVVNDSGLDTTAFRLAGRAYERSFGVVPDATRPLAKAFGGTWIQTLMVRASLVKQMGGFDPHLNFAEDYDFLFRLSLVTRYCYVNVPLAIIDRSNTPPGATCRPWDRVEVRLRARSYMYEKWLRLGADLPPDVKTMIVQNLRAVHSMWANWYLENRRYAEARHAISKAMTYEFTPNLALKWMLANIAPFIARKVVPSSKSYLA